MGLDLLSSVFDLVDSQSYVCTIYMLSSGRKNGRVADLGHRAKLNNPRSKGRFLLPILDSLLTSLSRSPADAFLSISRSIRLSDFFSLSENPPSHELILSPLPG